jgi:signal transduction histidine kinase
MTAVAANPAAPAAAQERHRLIMADECGWRWLVLLGGLAGQAARVAEADRERAVFPRPVHVGEIVAAALEALGPQPKPVLADIPSGLPEVMTDPAIAERVIVNLAGNALRYSPAAPPLLTARTAGNRVELRVVDHGPGIPAADRKRMFQPFRPGG